MKYSMVCFVVMMVIVGFGAGTAEAQLSATGGTETDDGGDRVHTFTSSGTLNVTGSGDVEVLVVAGGGGGGGGTAAGGGAGGLVSTTLSLSSGNYTVTVGQGGAGGNQSTGQGSDGENSTFGALVTGIGGGGGGSNYVNEPDGRLGGSGGGASYGTSAGTAGLATSGQGNVGGGMGASWGPYRCGGGGGAGSVGTTSSNTQLGDGGAGLSSDIIGTTTWYAGGGGGGVYNEATGGSGGQGGGGNGGANGLAATSADPNTGGGGGGQGQNNAANAGSGGSGIVIVRYSLAVDPITFAGLSASGITTNGATFNATLGVAATNADVYVHWGPTDGTNDAAAWTNTAYVGSWTNVASTNITFSTNGLSSGTLYYYTFSGSNDATNIWASPSASFTTHGAPVVDTAGGVTNIDVGAATLQGRVVATNGAPLTHVRIYFGDNDGGETHSWDTNYVFSVGSITEGVAFSTNLTGLLYGVQYSYRTYASNTYGEAWSAEETFTTLPPAGGSGSIDFGDLTVTCSDQFSGREAADAFNGVGLNVSEEHDTNPNNMWLSSDGGGPSDEWLKVGLGGTYNLSHLRVWNYHEYAGGFPWLAGRGVRQCDIYYAASDPGVNTHLSGATFNNSGWSLLTADQILSRTHGGSGTTTNSDPHISLGSVSAAYLAIKVDDNWPDADGYVGLSEVQIYWASPSPIGIANTAAANVDSTTADLEGTLDATQSVFTVTVYWSTNNNANAGEWQGDSSASNQVVDTYTNVVGQALSASVSGLTPSTTYYYTMVAANEATNIWASPNAFFGTMGAPEASNNGGATDVGGFSATLNGMLTAGGVADAYIVWGTNNPGTQDTNDWENVVALNEVSQNAPFSTPISGLSPNTTHFYRCFVTNEVDGGWSTITNFTTIPPVGINLYWDGAVAGGIGDGASQGGTANWSTSVTNWDQGNGLNRVAWDNTLVDKAHFAGTAGTVTLDGNISLGAMDFRNVSGSSTYYIGSVGETDSLGFADANHIGLNAENVTFRSGISGGPDIDLSQMGSRTLTLAPEGALTMDVGSIHHITNNGNFNVILDGASTANSVDEFIYTRNHPQHRWYIHKNGSGTWTVNGFGGNANEMDIYVNDGMLVLTGVVDDIEWIRVGNAPGDDAILAFSDAGATLEPGRFEWYGGIVSNASGAALTFTDGDQTWRSDGITFTGGDMDLGTGNGTLSSTDNPVTVDAGTTVTIGGVIDDSTASRNLVKRGDGTLSLTGNNTYDGSTVVEGGTLSISQAYLDDSSTIYITNNAVLDLNFAVTDTVFVVYFNGVQAPGGEWGGPLSSAANKTNALSGTGILSFSGGLAPAGTWFWDGPNAGGTGDGASDGGGGTWSTSNDNWDQGLVTRKVWPDTTNDFAFFRTLAGTVDLQSDVTLSGMLIEGVDNYVIGSDPETQTMTFGGMNSITVKLVKATFRAGIAGSPDLHLHGDSNDQLYMYPDSASMTLGNVTVGGGAGAGNNPILYLGGSTTGNSIAKVINGNNWSRIFKQGTGTWTVGDVAIGGLNIQAGTLVLNGTYNPSYTPFHTFTGGTLAGTGDHNHPLTVPVGGTVSPGDATGTLTVPSADINGTLSVTVDEAQAAQSSLLSVAGALDITGATLEVTVVGSADARSHVVATAGSLTGTFGTVNSAGGYDVKIAGNTILLSRDKTVFMFK